MSNGDGYVVYAAAYDNTEDAKADFTAIKELHRGKFIGYYESALFQKDDAGNVKILNTDETPRARGAIVGATVGAVLGLLFPPSLPLLAASGAGAGALFGHISAGLPHDSIRDMAELLKAGQTGIILFGETTLAEGWERLLKSTTRVVKKEIDVDAAQLKKALDEAVKT